MTDTLVLSVGRAIVHTQDGGTVPLSWGDPLPSDLAAGELDRLRGLGAVATADEFAAILAGIGVPIDAETQGPSVDGADVTFRLDEASPVELASWIRETKPTESSLIDLINGDAELAVRVIDAESVATDGDPRKLTQVAKIANRA